MKTDQDIIIKKEDLEEVALQIQSSSMVLTEITQAIQEMGKEFYQLKVAGIEDKEGLETVHKARMIVKNTRVAVDHRRKELTEDAVKHQRNVNAAAKLLTEQLTPIETYLQDQEDVVEKEKARIRAEQIRIEEERMQKEADERAAAKLKEEEELLAKRRRELEIEAEERERERQRIQQQAEEDLRLQREEQERKDAELAEKQARLDQADKDRLVWEERIAKEQAELKEERRKMEEEKAKAAAKASAEAVIAIAVDHRMDAVKYSMGPSAENNELTPSEQSLAVVMDDIGIELSATPEAEYFSPEAGAHRVSAEVAERQRSERLEDKEKLTHRLKLLAEYADDHEPLITRVATEIWNMASVEILIIVQKALGDTHKL